MLDKAIQYCMEADINLKLCLGKKIQSSILYASVFFFCPRISPKKSDVSVTLHYNSTLTGSGALKLGKPLHRTLSHIESTRM